MGKGRGCLVGSAGLKGGVGVLERRAAAPRAALQVTAGGGAGVPGCHSVRHAWFSVWCMGARCVRGNHCAPSQPAAHARPSPPINVSKSSMMAAEMSRPAQKMASHLSLKVGQGMTATPLDACLLARVMLHV